MIGLTDQVGASRPHIMTLTAGEATRFPALKKVATRVAEPSETGFTTCDRGPVLHPSNRRCCALSLFGPAARSRFAIIPLVFEGEMHGDHNHYTHYHTPAITDSKPVNFTRVQFPR